MTSDTHIHERCMLRAIELAQGGMGHVSPNPMTGAVIVQGEEIVGEGYCPTKGAEHAEVHALEAAKERAAGATVYVNLEPCLQHGRCQGCAERFIESKIARLFVATADPNPRIEGKGIQRLQEAGIDVVIGTCAESAKRLNEFYFKFSLIRRPFVTLVSAMSLDGKIATYLRDSEKITSPTAHAYVQQLRAHYDAVAVGINTILQDNPQLTCKTPGGRDPWKIIIDSQAKTPLNSKVLLRSDSSCIRSHVIIATSSQVTEERILAMQQAGAEVIHCSESNEHTMTPQVDLSGLMHILSKRGISSILLEGGGTLNASALQAGIVDKVIFMIAPKLVGGKEARTPVEGEGVALMSEAIPVYGWEYETLGADLLVTGYLSH